MARPIFVLPILAALAAAREHPAEIHGTGEDAQLVLVEFSPADLREAGSPSQ